MPRAKDADSSSDSSERFARIRYFTMTTFHHFTIPPSSDSDDGEGGEENVWKWWELEPGGSWEELLEGYRWKKLEHMVGTLYCRPVSFTPVPLNHFSIV